jgi:DNA/RNA-binding domain of Phe-tRNA-synthetase-like protein
VRLVVEREIWNHFPGMRLVLVWADSIDNRTERPEIHARLNSSVRELRAGWSHPNPQSHPNVAAWRSAFKAVGISGKRYPSSIEALTRRALSGRGVGSINPLVDVYNSVSLAHVVPAGGWDLDDFDRAGADEIRLAMTRGGERFRQLGSEETVDVDAGEVSYLVGDQVVTRHFVWRQSDLGKLTPDTRRVLLVSEILADVGVEGAEREAVAIEAELVSSLERYFRCDAWSAVLYAGAEPLTLDD